MMLPSCRKINFSRNFNMKKLKKFNIFNLLHHLKFFRWFIYKAKVSEYSKKISFVANEILGMFRSVQKASHQKIWSKSVIILRQNSNFHFSFWHLPAKISEKLKFNGIHSKFPSIFSVAFEPRIDLYPYFDFSEWFAVGWGVSRYLSTYFSQI